VQFFVGHVITGPREVVKGRKGRWQSKRSRTPLRRSSIRKAAIESFVHPVAVDRSTRWFSNSSCGGMVKGKTSVCDPVNPSFREGLWADEVQPVRAKIGVGWPFEGTIRELKLPSRAGTRSELEGLSERW
jgi:hypothetical protein